MHTHFGYLTVGYVWEGKNVMARTSKDRLSKVRKILGRFTTPLLPDDYSVLINPRWSTRELRGTIAAVRREADVVHLDIVPGWGVPTQFEPGQFIGIGVEVDGRYIWRSYSLTCTPTTSASLLSITVRAVEHGKLSNHLVGHATPGTTVRLSAPAGSFHLPTPLPPKLALIAAGTGITPIISMLRTMAERQQFAETDVVLVYSIRDRAHGLFLEALARMSTQHPQLRVVVQETSSQGRVTPETVASIVPDITSRTVFACGPSTMLDAYESWANKNHVNLTTERFLLNRKATTAQGGTVSFGQRASVLVDGATTVLEAGEQAGVQLPFGCRMGLCHTCVRPLTHGHATNLVTGETHEPGSRIRTCVCVAAGDITIEA